MTELETLQKAVTAQEKQIKALKQAIDILNRRGADTNKRVRTNSDKVRRAANDINTIKRKLGR